jgi:hypothetical protein
VKVQYSKFHRIQIAGITLQMSRSFEFVAERYKRQPRLESAYWGSRRELTRKDAGTVTVRQLVTFLDTQGQ